MLEGLGPYDAGLIAGGGDLVYLLDRMGVRPETIGDSTGRVEHLSDV